MKSTIGRKIIFAFFIILVLMGAMVGISSLGLNKVVSSLDEIEIEAFKRGASGNLRFNIAQLLMTSNGYIITDKNHYKREYNRLNSNIDDFYKQFIQLPLNEEEKQLVGEIKQDLDSICAISEKIFSIPHPRQSPEAWALMETMDYRFGSDVNLKTTQIFNGISHRIEAYRLQAAASKTNASNSIYGIMFVGMLITLVVGYHTVQRIAKPIVIVTKAANGIANGDYSLRPSVKTHDEISVLAESFCYMADSIQQTQKALEESKRLTEAIVETVPIGLLVFDSDGKILNVNNSFYDIFGFERNILIGQNIEPMFENLKAPEECRKHILTRDPVSDVECNYSHPVKGLRIMNLTLYPIRLTDRESLLMIEDITKRKHDEQIISDSEKRFRSLIENSTDGLAIINTEGIVFYESPVNSKITGYEQGELISQNAFSLILRDDYSKVMGLFKELLKDTSKVISAEFRIRHKNETIRWIEASAKNLLDELIIGGVVVNFRDITERKRAEEELREIETAIEQTADCVAITDNNGVIQYVNPAFTKITGYSREEALGKTPRIMKSGLHPPEFYEVLWKTILSGEVFRETFINRKKDGELFYDLRTITPIKDKDGNITHFVSTAKEVTEQRRAEAALKKSEERYHGLIEHASDGIFITDANGKYIEVNSSGCAMLGYTRDEILQKTIKDFVKILSDKPLQLEELNQGKILLNERELIRKDGSLVPVEISAKQLPDGNLLGIVRDITERKRAEVKLETERNLLRTFIEAIPDEVYVKDLQGKFILANEATVKGLGKNSATEVIGKTDRELLPPRWIDQAEKEEETILASGQPMLNREGVPNIDPRTGEIRRCLLISKIPLRDSEGKINGIIGLNRDIANIRRMETSLKRSEERMRIALHHSPITVFNQDLDLRFTWIYNPPAPFDADQILGKTDYDLMTAEDAAAAVAIKRQVLESGAGTRQEIKRLIGDTTYYFDLTVEPLRDNGNKIIGITCAAIDITERKHGEKEISMLANALKSIHECVSITDMENNILFVNKSFEDTFGYTEEELIGQHIRIVRSPNNPPELLEAIKPATLRGGWQGELWNQRKDGREFPIFLSTTIVHDKDRKPIALIGVAIDITERKHAEQELINAKERAEQSDKLKDAFIANISHEIRTPLNIILGYTGVIEETFAPEATEEEQIFFSSVQSGADRLMRTVDLVLNVSRVHAGDVTLKLETIRVPEFIEKLIQELTPEAQKKSLALSFINDFGHLAIHADTYCLSQAFMNLIDNAIKYTKKGSVTVRLYQNQNDVHLDITDTGIGISEEYLTHIYKPYSQEQSGYTRGYEGIGLGLTLVKQYLSLHNVPIAVTSKKGYGSTFTICLTNIVLPNYLPEPTENISTNELQAQPASVSDAETPLHKPIILLIEDDIPTQEYMQLVLSKKFEIMITDSVEGAWEIIRSRPIDLILLDISLQGNKNGLDLVLEIRKSETFSKLPIIAVTAHAFPVDRMNSLEAGCNGFIAKPMSRTKLFQMINEVMQKD